MTARSCYCGMYYGIAPFWILFKRLVGKNTLKGMSTLPRSGRLKESFVSMNTQTHNHNYPQTPKLIINNKETSGLLCSSLVQPTSSTPVLLVHTVCLCVWTCTHMRMHACVHMCICTCVLLIACTNAQ